MAQVTNEQLALDRLLTYGRRESDGTNEGTLFLFEGGQRFFLSDRDARSLRTQGGVRVKPLEWVDIGEGPRCITVCGMYAIYPSLSRGSPTLSLSGMTKGLFSKFASIYAAKAAAQADYERRILSSLEASPAHVNIPAETEQVSRDVLTDAPAPVSEAVLDVLTERKRQVETEGWTLEHDDSHSHGEMATAAACYAAPNAVYWGPVQSRAALEWPWDISWWKPSDGKRGRPADRRRDLVKAAALILAEIERLDRAALAAKGGQ